MHFSQQDWPTFFSSPLITTQLLFELYPVPLPNNKWWVIRAHAPSYQCAKEGRDGWNTAADPTTAAAPLPASLV